MSEVQSNDERITRLRRWFNSAKSTYQEATWERRFWIVISLLGLVLEPVRNSLPALYFMSSWALVKGSSNEKALAKQAMLEEQAEEVSDGDDHR